MDEKFLKPYDPVATEPKIYKIWEESGFFNPDVCAKRGVIKADLAPYSIILPPPNVTGRLHMGHALMLAIEDVLIRYKRMTGHRTLWLPGTDHAAIATQSVVEKKISKEEGKSRHDLGREAFLARVQEFAQESHDTIINQVKTMGASLDWSREVFTLDEARSRAVRTMFKRMYDAGLIYRGNRIINWDPKGQTTISDDEIVYEERKAKLYTFTYSKDFPIAISTTRPETKVGDTAVAVHPDDARYKEFVGKEYEFTFCDVPVRVKIVADAEVDPEFGTGALGVTPAHSQTDWEIADRHDLPRPQVINEYAKMMVEGRLSGKKTTEARELVVEWLKNEGLLLKEEEITQNISTAERTGGIVEPLPKLQWFIAVNKEFTIPHSKIPGIASGSTTTLRDLMRAAVADAGIEIMPEHASKTYFHWVDTLRDWCISRQIWYGHRVPVWYRNDELYVGTEAPEGEGWEQDPDTLDTWFSSGLWTFSTMGWPDAWDSDKGDARPGSDLAVWRPTDVLETGYDILFFWVARMILMTGFALGEIPFKRVYLHGLVRDAQGRKMSKSLGNNLDPVEVTGKYGADAVRMSLIVGNTPGTDMRISEDKVKGYKHFANKLWNISRFIFDNTQGADFSAPLTDDDQVLRSHFEHIAEDVTRDLEAYRIYLAAEKLYHYAWHELADELIESSKVVFAGEDPEAQASRRALLSSILDDLLKLLHPFMPFVTEEIWQHTPFAGGLLMVTPWPVKIEVHGGYSA
ncbi:MAG TPA: valine--tRNA ligase [Candidatus Paceibacterota bacterium]|nr:valine--tRNA ligase [Candidatus Paceibacterota bacterium]